MQVLQPQGLFINKPFYTSIHKPCFYTSPAFKQALLLHKSVFTQDLLLHKPCFYTSAVFTQALLLHKTCFYTNAVFTQALSLHKHCLYTRPAFTQKRFYTRPPFTQTLSLHKLCLYTSIAFIQALLLHNDILLTKAFCNLQTGNRLEGRRNAEGCKYTAKIRPKHQTWLTNQERNHGPVLTLFACFLHMFWSTISAMRPMPALGTRPRRQLLGLVWRRWQSTASRGCSTESPAPGHAWDWGCCWPREPSSRRTSHWPHGDM